MTLQEKIAIEEDASGYLHLYLEGIFWKSYQQSAYLMCQKMSRLKVTRKYIQTVRCEVVSVGFPDSALSSYLEDQECERLDAKRIRVKCAPPDSEAYAFWFSSAGFLPVKNREYSVCGSLTENNILRQLKEFRLEESTPVECMLFLADLRRMLD
jgi:hypothetical protein